ncbi:hypothetical protein G4V39_05755 [Thermosulfuriphilus ammonigenes]|uniref:Uncharacterized protein n=1 Tax=Thermosulfuriphilus ammonigenes TaxID=1936021 RepID=A0A6G7PWH2_9BACT|nr:hypothetical protein [Thermosulfuriphilus ammonigenes]MBA2848017.1 hypothetical protein [Thermosulfuriphilus ammonigenes]QIJ71798.1 hypothetical protein G4V39_05755 [Thermosulfuriphilus ammonigenes]
MKRIIFLPGLLIICLSLFYGCASTPKGSSPSLSAGKAYYLKECGACHRHIRPEERTASEWPAILERHRIRVSLTPEQFDSLSQYILAGAKKDNSP